SARSKARRVAFISDKFFLLSSRSPVLCPWPRGRCDRSKMCLSGQENSLQFRLRTCIGVSGRSGEPWLRFVWSCWKCPDPGGRRRVKRSVYLHAKGARGQEHAEEAT